jgi:threonine/homoserine/homoserine lactone efflux protein
MLDRHLLVLFLTAATLLAITPGPGITEVLNPKTALFFLSFVPQFVNPALRHVVMQFLLLGILSVSLNTIADLVVVSFAAPIGARLRSSARFRRNQRVASGVGMIGLGAFVAFSEK